MNHHWPPLMDRWAIHGTICSVSEYQYFTILWGCYLNSDVSTPLFIHCSIIVCDRHGVASEMLVVMSDYKAINCSLYCGMSKSVKYGRWEAEDVKRVLEAFQNSDISLNAASH